MRRSKLAKQKKKINFKPTEYPILEGGLIIALITVPVLWQR
jgi:hypothetical protein